MKAELTRRASLTDAVLALFKSRPSVWIDAHELAQVGGFAAWRTRVADARKIIRADGGIIENRQIRRSDMVERDASGIPARLWIGASVVSEYRYLAHTPLGRAADVPAPVLWPAPDAPYQERFELKP